LWDEKGEPVKFRTPSLGIGETPGATRITRKDFLKMGGTGLAGAALLGTAGCGSIFGGEQGGTGGGGGKSITLNLQDTIRDLDSTTTTDTVSYGLLLNVIEGLYRLDENENPQPGQAEKVEISADKLTYTFTLRDGITWSNGDPVTSQDFKYAWLRALDPETAGQYAYILSTFIEGAAKYNEGKGTAEDVAVEAPDDKTLEVRLVAPSPFWLGLTAFHTYLPQNQRFVEEQGDQYAQNADALLYNGPYVLSEVNPAEGATLVKNDDYWDAETVDIQRVEGSIVKELATAVNLHESGDLDVTEISQEYVTEYRDSEDFYSLNTASIFYLVPNEDTVPLFRNENIRKALQMSFQKQALTNNILRNGSEPADGFVPPGIAGPEGETFREAQGPVTPEYDPEEARRLFQQGIEEEGGENPTIELLSYDTATGRDLATFLQSQLQDNLGAKIDVLVQPFDRKLELEANGEFQLSYQGWIADYNDPMTFLDLWETDSPFNTGGYSNERYDDLIAQAKEETDDAKRMDLLLEAERILIKDDAACAPIYYEGVAWLVEPSIKNFTYYRLGGANALRFWRLQG
jgi:oligopeptide transport system substrate-binding protein